MFVPGALHQRGMFVQPRGAILTALADHHVSVVGGFDDQDVYLSGTAGQGEVSGSDVEVGSGGDSQAAGAHPVTAALPNDPVDAKQLGVAPPEQRLPVPECAVTVTPLGYWSGGAPQLLRGDDNTVVVACCGDVTFRPRQGPRQHRWRQSCARADLRCRVGEPRR